MKAGKRVLICEGERDANTAVGPAFLATTNPGGVNKWFGEYDEFFRDADVVIVSDNDPQSKDPKTGALQFHPDGRPIHPGQDHAAKVAKHMRKAAKQPAHRHLPAERPDRMGRGRRNPRCARGPDRGRDPSNSRSRRSPITAEAEEILAELNRDNQVLLDGARTMVLRFEEVPHEAGGERYIYRLPMFLRFSDFRNYYLNRYLQVGDDSVSIGNWWLVNPDRRHLAKAQRGQRSRARSLFERSAEMHEREGAAPARMEIPADE